jgi:tyrosyl-tRNA synthetase
MRDAEAQFNATYLADGVPDDVPEVSLQAGGPKLLLAKALAQAKLVGSNSDGRRLISQGGVEVDGERVRDAFFELEVGRAYLVRVGSKSRKFCRIRVTP